MNPLDILQRLEDAKDIDSVLESIPEDNEFWIGAHHGLSHLSPYPVEFALRNPLQYGDGVPVGVFPKILNGMMNGTLSAVAVVDAISAFSVRCTEDEWTKWYLPILEKRLRLPVMLTQFNKHCPNGLQVATAYPAAFHKAGEVLPTKFILEPYLPTNRILVILSNSSTFVFNEDGTPLHRLLPTVFKRLSGNNVVLEMYEEGDRYTLRDIIMWDQFINPDVPSVPVEQRLSVLRNVFGDTNAVDVIEHIVQDGSTNIRDDISAFFQSGYSGVVFRTLGQGYHDEHANILVNPVRKSVLTCTDITPGKNGTKYQDVAEYIHGRGTMNKKKFESPVFHGLTFSDRSTCLQSKEQYIGKRFNILSCGLDSKGKLIFPVFKQWKE